MKNTNYVVDHFSTSEWVINDQGILTLCGKRVTAHWRSTLDETIDIETHYFTIAHVNSEIARECQDCLSLMLMRSVK